LMPINPTGSKRRNAASSIGDVCGDGCLSVARRRDLRHAPIRTTGGRYRREEFVRDTIVSSMLACQARVATPGLAAGCRREHAERLTARPDEPAAPFAVQGARVH